MGIIISKKRKDALDQILMDEESMNLLKEAAGEAINGGLVDFSKEMASNAKDVIHKVLQDEETKQNINRVAVVILSSSRKETLTRVLRDKEGMDEMKKADVEVLSVEIGPGLIGVGVGLLVIASVLTLSRPRPPSSPYLTLNRPTVLVYPPGTPIPFLEAP